jgi:hypothetical protein
MKRMTETPSHIQEEAESNEKFLQNLQLVSGRLTRNSRNGVTKIIQIMFTTSMFYLLILKKKKKILQLYGPYFPC